MPRPLFKDARSDGIEKGRGNPKRTLANRSRPSRTTASRSSSFASTKTSSTSSTKQSVKSEPSSPEPGLSYSVPWAIKHAPQSLDEVAMHPAKLNEICTAMSPESSTRVLVLSGPAGSSKSEAVQAVARHRGQKVVEFHAPEATVGSTTLVTSFREFLVGAAMHDRDSTIVLVEELPSLFHEDTRQDFEHALIDWSAEPHQPVVVVSFTEIEVSAKYSEALVVPRVLGRLVTEHAHVLWLKSNPLNTTLLQRVLKRVLEHEALKLPATTLKALAACGDVRSALNAAELCSRLPAPPSTGADLGMRGTPVELFYAIGKVVWTSSKQGSLEEALAMFDDSMETFCLTVLENYTSAKHSRLPVSAAASATEWLSMADTGAQESAARAGQQFSARGGGGGPVLGMHALGALGAADAIAQSEPQADLPKQFVQTRFTQFPKWRAEQINEEARLQRTLRNLRPSQPATNRAVVLDEQAYASHFPQPSVAAFLGDDEDEDDDDDF